MVGLVVGIGVVDGAIVVVIIVVEVVFFICARIYWCAVTGAIVGFESIVICFYDERGSAN